MFLIFAQLIFIAVLPALFAGAAGLLYWNQFDRPWAFLLVGVVGLYAAYVAIFSLLPSHPVGFMLQANEQSSSVAKTYDVTTIGGLSVLPIVGAYGWHLLLFLLVAVPSLWVLVKFFPSKAP